MGSRTYDDTSLTEAVAAARSWRDVLRRLGLSATSASAIRSVRVHADRLGLDHSHFTGQRRWSDAELARAVATSRTWSEVLTRLDLAGGSSTSALRGHALRLGIDASHLGRRPVPPAASISPKPDAEHLPRAGAMLAAAWFTLCGYDVSWPLEPCRYDLAVVRGRSVLRIQVKTTRSRAGDTWVASLQSGGRRRGSYDPDDIDYFFVIDANLDQYLIPVATVGGLQRVQLSCYQQYRLAPLSLMGESAR